MTTRANTLEIHVDGQKLDATLVGPDTMVPGVLLVHGWDGSQSQYVARAHDIASMGCICLTFDLRGHARHGADRHRVTRGDNLRDVLAAYDELVAHPAVDPSAVAIIGSSYGAYLAAIATSLRQVRWLGLRVPAIYEDEDWDAPKYHLDRKRLMAYRQRQLTPEKNRALAACAEFRGDVMIVESEHDRLVPHATVRNYLNAFAQSRSTTYRVIAGADHALSDPAWQQNYTSLLVQWMNEMVLGARAASSVPAVSEVAMEPTPAMPAQGD